MQTLELILTNKSITTREQVESWQIPETTTQDQWEEGHKQLLLVQQITRKLLPKSQSFGVKHFGVDALIEIEAAFQLEFGLPSQEEKPVSNNTEITVIDYLEKGFKRLASRSQEFETWDTERLQRAVALLEPVSETLLKLRNILSAKDERAGG